MYCGSLVNLQRIPRLVAIPIQSPENLSSPVLPTTVATGGKLHGERRRRAIVTLDSQASPAIAVRTAVLVLGPESADPHEVVVTVFVLQRTSIQLSSP